MRAFMYRYLNSTLLHAAGLGSLLLIIGLVTPGLLWCWHPLDATVTPGPRGKQGVSGSVLPSISASKVQMTPKITRASTPRVGQSDDWWPTFERYIRDFPLFHKEERDQLAAQDPELIKYLIYNFTNTLGDFAVKRLFAPLQNQTRPYSFPSPPACANPKYEVSFFVDNYVLCALISERCLDRMGACMKGSGRATVSPCLGQAVKAHPRVPQTRER